MKSLIIAVALVALASSPHLASAQAVPSAPPFNPARDYTITGTWTFDTPPSGVSGAGGGFSESGGVSSTSNKVNISGTPGPTTADALLRVYGASNDTPMVRIGTAGGGAIGSAGNDGEGFQFIRRTDNILEFNRARIIYFAPWLNANGTRAVNEPIIFGGTKDEVSFATSDDDDHVIIYSNQVAIPGHQFQLRGKVGSTGCATVYFGTNNIDGNADEKKGLAIAVSDNENSTLCTDPDSNLTLVMAIAGDPEASDVGHVWFGPYGTFPGLHMTYRLNIPNNEFLGTVEADGQTAHQLIGLNTSDRMVTDLWTWPAADGTASQCLTTDGAGSLAFVACAASIGPGTTNKIPRWTSSSNIGDSAMTELGGTLTVAENVDITAGNTLTVDTIAAHSPLTITSDITTAKTLTVTGAGPGSQAGLVHIEQTDLGGSNPVALVVKNLNSNASPIDIQSSTGVSIFSISANPYLVNVSVPFRLTTDTGGSNFTSLIVTNNDSGNIALFDGGSGSTVTIGATANVTTTGVFAAGAGSAGAPAYGLSGATNGAGLFLVGATTVGISTNGERMIAFDNNGVNKGIFLDFDAGFTSDNAKDFGFAEGGNQRPRDVKLGRDLYQGGRHQRDTQATTLAAAAATFALTKDVVLLTGDAGLNTVTTITGGLAGQVIYILFQDANVTLSDSGTGANQLQLFASFMGTADDVLTLVYNGTYWQEIARSVN